MAVAIARVAVQTGLAHRSGPKALEGRGAQREIALEEHLAVVEGAGEPLCRDGRRLILVAALRDVERGAQLSAGVPFVGRKITDSLSYVFSVGLFGLLNRLGALVPIYAGNKSHGQ